MRFVPTKSEQQQSGLMLHRGRQLLVRQRTMLSMRSAGMWRNSASSRPRAAMAWLSCLSSLRTQMTVFRRPHGLALRFLPANTQMSRQRSAPSRSASMRGTDRVKKAGGSRKSRALARSSPPLWSPRWAIGRHSHPAQPGSLDRPCSQAAFDRWQGAPRRHLKAGQSIYAMAARRRRYGGNPICAAARHEAALACAYHGTSADQGRCCRAGQQNRAYGVGHDGTRRTLQGAEIALGSGIANSRSRASMNWRGHDDVMQIRSFRGSENPLGSSHFRVRVNDWDPIRAEH